MEQEESKEPFLEGITGLYQNKDYLITTKEFVIGRNPDCHLVMKESTISGRHAKIIRTGDIYEIMDLDSTNKTYVNGEPVSRKRLRTADKIRLDVFEFTFVNPGDVVRTELSNEGPSIDMPRTIVRSDPADTRSPISDRTKPMIKEDLGIKPGRPERPGNLFTGLLLGLAVAYILSWGGLLLGLLLQNQSVSTGFTTMFQSQLISFPILHIHTHWLNISPWTPAAVAVLICLFMGPFIGGIVVRDIGRRRRSHTALIFSLLYVLIAVTAQLTGLRFDLAAWQNLARGAGLGMATPLLNLVLVLAYFWAVCFLISFAGTLFGKK